MYYIDLEIGKTFEFEEDEYEVVEDINNINCEICDFLNNDECLDLQVDGKIPTCECREDDKAVIFKKLKTNQIKNKEEIK